jgi:hypothetical protein
MCSVPIDSPAVTRAQWLAELSDALDDAQQLLMELELSREEQALAVETFLRIEAARLEVQSLRLSRSLSPRAAAGSERSEPKDRCSAGVGDFHKPCGMSPPPANGSR